MIRVGIIGINEGNGHPYSFSCIINGFNEDELRNSGWDVIYNYIRIQDKADLGIDNVVVTHVWTQDLKESKKIAAAANISNVVENYAEMIGEIDALIIARDDFEQHLIMAKPFLDSGCFVFIDKPLSLNFGDLNYFKPYLDSGKLMSCSGMRYAGELDIFRKNLESYGQIKLIRGAVLNNIEKYGIHMLEAIYGCIPFEIEKVLAINSGHESVVFFNKDGSIFQLDALGNTVKTFQLDVFGSKGRFHAELNNNFVAFRRTLVHFFTMVRNNIYPYNPELTLSLMKAMIAYKLSKKENRVVKMEEIHV